MLRNDQRDKLRTVLTDECMRHLANHYNGDMALNKMVESQVLAVESWLGAMMTNDD